MASPWDSWLEALPLYTAKDYEGATAIMARALERHPDNPNVLYNLACFEALAGHRAEALAHLVRSAELDPNVPWLGERRLRPRLDPGRARVPREGREPGLGGRVGPKLGSRDQTGLLGRL